MNGSHQGPRKCTRLERGSALPSALDVVAVLSACREAGITPELGVMDIGFDSNAVALREDGFLPTASWFLLELDSPSYGGGAQVAPSTLANYDVLSIRLRNCFPGAVWAGHGNGVATYDTVHRSTIR